MTAVQQAGSVWDGLVGQRAAITALRAAAGGQGMSHAWLFGIVIRRPFLGGDSPAVERIPDLHQAQHAVG